MADSDLRYSKRERLGRAVFDAWTEYAAPSCLTWETAAPRHREFCMKLGEAAEHELAVQADGILHQAKAGYNEAVERVNRSGGAP